MGARRVTPFDDDDGAAFVAEIVRSRDIAVIADAVYAIPVGSEGYDGEGYVERGTAIGALVAAEVLAAQRASESGDVPDELQSWTDEQGDVDEQLVSRAICAVRRIVRDSELTRDGNESAAVMDWRGRCVSVLRRLGRK